MTSTLPFDIFPHRAGPGRGRLCLTMTQHTGKGIWGHFDRTDIAETAHCRSLRTALAERAPGGEQWAGVYLLMGPGDAADPRIQVYTGETDMPILDRLVQHARGRNKKEFWTSALFFVSDDLVAGTRHLIEAELIQELKRTPSLRPHNSRHEVGSRPGTIDYRARAVAPTLLERIIAGWRILGATWWYEGAAPPVETAPALPPRRAAATPPSVPHPAPSTRAGSPGSGRRQVAPTVAAPPSHSARLHGKPLTGPLPTRPSLNDDQWGLLAPDGQWWVGQSLAAIARKLLATVEAARPGFLVVAREATLGTSRTFIATTPAALYPGRPGLERKAREIAPGWWMDANKSEENLLSALRRALASAPTSGVELWRGSQRIL